MPAASAASSIGPDSRVSRTIRTCGLAASSEATAARPRALASSAVRNVPTSPRTPSVPKSFRSTVIGATSALGELRPLARLLQARLAALLGPRIPGEESTPLQLAPKLGVDLGQRSGDAVADSPCLTADAAAVHPHAHVDGLLVTGRSQRQANGRLVQGPREELLEGTLVDLDLAAARDDGHAGDRRLALARRQEA